jgi:hypothetical protein
VPIDVTLKKPTFDQLTEPGKGSSTTSSRGSATAAKHDAKLWLIPMESASTTDDEDTIHRRYHGFRACTTEVKKRH